MTIFISRGGRQMLARKSVFERWDKLPYGLWTCEDGREVLFSRFYEPLFERMPGEPIKPAAPNERVWWVKQVWFYNDSIRSEEKRRRLAAAALAKWEAGEPPIEDPEP